MAGTLPGIANTQRVDAQGGPLVGGKLYLYNAVTLTPAAAFKDFNLTTGQEQPFPLVLDAWGQIPPFYLADGFYRARLTNASGSTVLFDIDETPSVGASSDGGGGGGSPVDANSILKTGFILPVLLTGTLAGFVRCNARTIGNASSGATERANSDTSSLFAFLWNLNIGLTVSGGRGTSAAVDYAANKTIALPDLRGRGISGLDDMGNSSAARLSGIISGSTALGTAGGVQTNTLAQANLPNIVPQFTGTNGEISVTSTVGDILRTPNGISASAGSSANTGGTSGAVNSNGTFTPAGTISSINGNVTQTSVGNVQPTMVMTLYIKL